MLITSFLLLQGCDFEFTHSVIPTIGFHTPIPQPWSFQSFDPTPTLSPEMTELVEAIDLLFDPYRGTLPDEMIYADSIYEKLDRALAEAYRNCGIDLGMIAYTSTNNPMTEQKFFDCTTTVEVKDPDPFSNVQYSTLDWMYKRIISSGENPAYSIFLIRIGVDRKNPLNFEPNYLDALMHAYPEEVKRTKGTILTRVLELNNGDPTEALEFMEIYKLGLLGTE